MNLANAPYGASAAMVERRSFDGSVAVIPISYLEREFSMAKSRAEVLASLRGIFADGDSKPEPKAKSKASEPTNTATATATFGKFRKADKVEPVAEEPEQEDEVAEEESEDGDSDSNYTTNGHSDDAEDVEVAPVEELLERVESLIDYIADNSEALKAWLAACR